jgi:hypothetical protein
MGESGEVGPATAGGSVRRSPYFDKAADQSESKPDERLEGGAE